MVPSPQTHLRFDHPAGLFSVYLRWGRAV